MIKIQKEKLRQWLLVAAETCVIVGIMLAAVAPISCKITEQGITIVGGDYTPPVLNDFTVVDERTVRLEFSERVSVHDYVVAQVTDELFASEEHSDTLELSPALERVSGVYGSIPCSVTEQDDGTVIITLEEDMQVGQGYEFYSQVRDKTGNSLTLAIPFAGYNSRVPVLIMTELQTESVSSQRATEKEAGIYRNEFVELLVLRGGNLAGLELCSAYDGEAKKFLFPPIEVSTGEVFVVHMRSRGNGCVSETGDNLGEATSSYTSAEVRDLWTDIETTTLGNKTDIILLRNRADRRLLDAVMYRASNIEAWTKLMIDYSALVDESGIYESGDVENAFITDNMSNSKTMYRTDAEALRQQVMDGQEIELPVKSGAELWAVLDQPNPGSL
ncbi:MAG: hypothetical protein J5726_03225 [Treponema sp.]|nr:hypothetical protein [Treponema sp.]